ncbi:MAG: hypothetical protein KJ000_32645 [Pirellulaceae bacterium]|nr:hypothetical protein [Pirellulaceae bacterium]
MNNEFEELIQRVRSGDEQAACELLDRYGDAIRREIRFRLYDSRLYRVVGESDVFQSTIARFFVGLQLGRFDIQCPEDLLGLLKTIAERRVCSIARFWQAGRRDLRREQDLDPEMLRELAAIEETPSGAFRQDELIDQALARLPEVPRRILDWRLQGVSWQQITERLPGNHSPEAIRKQYNRAISQVASALSLHDG